MFQYEWSGFACDTKFIWTNKYIQKCKPKVDDYCNKKTIRISQQDNQKSYWEY